jgi:hypothetical protein
MTDQLQDLPEATHSYLGGHRLDEVECIIADLSGIPRGKAVPASKFARQTEFHPPNSYSRVGSLSARMCCAAQPVLLSGRLAASRNQVRCGGNACKFRRCSWQKSS